MSVKAGQWRNTGYQVEEVLGQAARNLIGFDTKVYAAQAWTATLMPICSNCGEHPGMIVFDREGAWCDPWAKVCSPARHVVHMAPDDTTFCTDDGARCAQVHARRC